MRYFSSRNRRVFKSSHTVPSTNQWVFAGHSQNISERRTMLWFQRVFFPTLREMNSSWQRLFSIGLKPKNDKDCSTFWPMKAVFFNSWLYLTGFTIFSGLNSYKSLVRCKSDDITRKWSSLLEFILLHLVYLCLFQGFSWPEFVLWLFEVDSEAYHVEYFDCQVGQRLTASFQNCPVGCTHAPQWCKDFGVMGDGHRKLGGD